MEAATIPWAFRADLWAAAAAMAWAASYVALDLARGMTSSHRPTSLRALAGAALALAAGLWAAHLIVLAGEPLPVALRYDFVLIFSALALAYFLTLAGLACSVGGKRTVMRSGLSAGCVGAAACAGPLVAVVALHFEPGPTLNYLGIAGAWAVSAVLAAAGLRAYAQRQRDVKPLVAGLWHVLAAVLIGAAMVSADFGVLHGVQLVAPATTSLGKLPSATLTALASVGVPVLLALLLLSSILESRFKELLRRTRDDLERAARTDPLTGLPNRAIFEESLQSEVARADRQQHRLALLFVNLDGLKSINQSFGQAAGDKVLRDIGQRLQALVGERAQVARAGGDEFLLLLAGNPSPQEASALAGRMLASLSHPCDFDSHDVSVPSSIGIAMYPEHGAMSTLIGHANAAMQAAKRTGGATYCFFEARMVAGAREQVELLHDLRRAIEHQEMELYYQPKIHAPSGQITGAEALMRWHHPQRGMISPGVFIPLAERFGLINALGNWLIEDVCRQIRAWRDEGLRMRVALNLSVHQLRQPDLVQRVGDALKRNRIEPGILTCEITESAAMEDMKVTLQVLEQLLALGVHVSIDDFGTGYSSLSYLRQLAAEELKIDRSFVMDLETSVDARAIVDAVVKLAQALGLKVVAEGVETVRQQEILRSLGCDELQGFLFAKPMSAKALALWATKDEGGPSVLDFRPSLFGDTMPAPV
jgi:diguanylate cyclase (GGDEF)-like protein